MSYLTLGKRARQDHPQIGLISEDVYYEYFRSTGVSTEFVELLATPTPQEAASLLDNLIADEEIKKEQLLICLLTHAKQHAYNLQLLQTCLEKIALPLEVSFPLICHFGFTNLLKFLSVSLAPERLTALLAHGDFFAFRNACASGHLELVEWLWQRCPEDKHQAMVAASFFGAFVWAGKNGHLEVVEWLWQHCLESKRQKMVAAYNFMAFQWACANGHLEIVEWLWQRCREDRRQTMLTANDEVVFAFAAFRWACKNGHLEVVKWLWRECSKDGRQEMVASNDFRAFQLACGGGHLKVVEWLWQKCPEDEHQAMLAANAFAAFQWACEGGHLKVVEWLWQHCLESKHQKMVAEYNFVAFRRACEKGQLAIVEWLWQRCREDTREAMVATHDFEAFRQACYYDHLATVVWLLTNSPACFAYAEMHVEAYGDEIATFLNDTIEQLRARCIDAADPSTLSLSTLERDRCFYLVRHLIRRPFWRGQNYWPGQYHFDFLLNIPALRDVAHRSPNPQEAPNELLRLAFDVEHEAAALRLLAIPNVRQAAVRDYYYLDYQMQVAADLAAVLRDRESSLRALAPHVRAQYESLAEHYEACIAQGGGAHKILDAMRTELAARYTANPACYDDAGQRHCLPLTWDEFEALNLSASAQVLALQAYYDHALHTTWRYFQQPNPWQDKHAALVIDGGADYRGYEPMLAVLWFAATDATDGPVAHQALDTRINHFITAMAMIARAHNWHGEQKQADGKIYECDDKKADRPSCNPGVNRRLGQMVELLFDAGAEIKTFTQLNQTLRDRLRTHFEQKLKHNSELLRPLKTLYDRIVIDYADLTAQDLALLGALNLTDAEIEQQVAAVVERYRDTFNRVPLQIYVKDYFSVRANPEPNLDASAYQSYFLWLRHSSSAHTWETMDALLATTSWSPTLLLWTASIVAVEALGLTLIAAGALALAVSFGAALTLPAIITPLGLAAIGVGVAITLPATVILASKVKNTFFTTKPDSPATETTGLFNQQGSSS